MALNETLIALAAKLKYQQGTGLVEITEDLLRREADAINVAPEDLRRAIAEAVLDRGDSGGSGEQ